MSRARYIPITCKSAINRVKGMPFNWSLNPYRGCVHACHYCYARETHAYLGLNAGRDFETSIFYKFNIVAVLGRELHSSGWAGESIAIGTATDAYQPAEGRFRLTRSCLEALARARNPAGIVTKSTLIKRDLDVLSELATTARVRVYFTVTTLDETIWRQLEPGTPPPIKRLQVMESLSAAGITTGVMMAPVIFGMTDSADSIQAVAEAAAAHGASSFTALPLRLAPLVKEHFLNFVVLERPDLYGWFAGNYRGRHAPEHWQELVTSRADEARAKFGIGSRSYWQVEPAVTPPHRCRQLSLM